MKEIWLFPERKYLLLLSLGPQWNFGSGYIFAHPEPVDGISLLVTWSGHLFICCYWTARNVSDVAYFLLLILERKLQSFCSSCTGSEYKPLFPIKPDRKMTKIWSSWTRSGGHVSAFPDREVAFLCCFYRKWRVFIFVSGFIVFFAYFLYPEVVLFGSLALWNLNLNLMIPMKRIEQSVVCS
jgi:hypothetical protein